MTIKDRLSWNLGDDQTITDEFYTDTAATAPLDITGRTYVMSVAATAGGTVLLSATGTVTGASGRVAYSFVDADIASDLGLGNFVYWCVETASGLEDTYVEGPLVVKSRGGS